MSNLYAGIDLGGTKVACALGSIRDGIAAQVTIPTNSWEGSQRVLERIGDAVEGHAAGFQHHVVQRAHPGG